MDIIGKLIMVDCVQHVPMVVRLAFNQDNAYRAFGLITSTVIIVCNVPLTAWNVMMGQPAQVAQRVF